MGTMQDNSKVANALRRMVSHTHKKGDVALVVSAFVRYSAAYLHHQVAVGRFYFNTAVLGKSAIEDAALDGISELFARDEHKQFYQLKRSFSEVAEIDDIDTISRVRQVVSSATRQNLLSIFKQVDPAGWRIYKNLSAVVDRRKCVRSFTDLQKEYYYYSNTELDTPDALNPSAPGLEWDNLKLHLHRHLRREAYLPQAVESFLSELKAMDDTQQFVSKIDLHRSIKEFYNVVSVNLDDVEYLVTDQARIPGDFSSEDQEKIFRKAIAIVKMNINNMYVLKKKLSPELGLEYQKILEGYFADLLLDGEVDRLPGYARRISTGVGDENWDVHQGKLEYLIKTTKEELRVIYESEFLRSPNVDLRNEEG